MIRQKSIIAVLLLSILTCGLYCLIWIYDTSAQLQGELKNANSPGTDLLLCLICFPYSFFWIYKTSKQIAEAEKNVGLPGTDNAVVNLLLTFFGLGLVSMLIMQGQLNDIAAKKAAN